MKKTRIVSLLHREGAKNKVKIAGIMFQDITTVLLDPKAFKDTIDLFVERYRDKNISVVAGKYYLSLQFIMLINFLYIVLFRWDYYSKDSTYFSELDFLIVLMIFRGNKWVGHVFSDV